MLVVFSKETCTTYTWTTRLHPARLLSQICELISNIPNILVSIHIFFTTICVKTIEFINCQHYNFYLYYMKTFPEFKNRFSGVAAITFRLQVYYTVSSEKAPSSILG